MENQKKKKIWTAVVSAGLFVGTLDIIAAFLLSLSRGGTPLRVLHYIASGVFGDRAFSGASFYAVCGLFFHYGIAIIWTLFYFLCAERVQAMRRHRVAAGIVFGIAVWIVMNVVVVPLSGTPPATIQWQPALISALILIVAIGLPLAFISERYFSQRGWLPGTPSKS